LRRSRYELKSVEGRMLEDGIGYVKIRVFAATTDQLLGDLLDQLQTQSKGLRGLVLDLRRNPAACSTRASGSLTASSPRACWSRPSARAGA